MSFLQLRRVSRVLGWLRRIIFALAMPLFLCINRQPIKFPLTFFPLCRQLLSAFPQQGQDVNKWSWSIFMLWQKILCVHELMQNNYTYQCIASNAVLSRWVKDCCRAGGSRTSCEPASYRWIYGFPMPSAGMGLACALSSEALQLLCPISKCCSNPCLCRWCNSKPLFLDGFLSFAKQMLPAAKHL